MASNSDGAVDESDDPRLQRVALITEPRLTFIPSVFGGSQFPLAHRTQLAYGTGSEDFAGTEELPALLTVRRLSQTPQKRRRKMAYMAASSRSGAWMRLTSPSRQFIAAIR